MKIALCLYGGLREFTTVRASLRQHVLPNFSVDLFACVWSQSLLGLYPSESSHPRHACPTVPMDYALEFMTLQPKQSYLTKSFVTYPEFQKALEFQRSKIGEQVFSCFPLHYWANLYAQEQAVQFSTGVDDYDFTIVSRADVFYLEPLLKNTVGANQITVHKRFGAGKPSDFWYSGPNQWCQTISKRFSDFPILSPGIENHPLTLFQNQINQHNFPIFFADLPIDMVQRRYTGWWWTPYERDPSIVKDIG